MQSVLPAQEPPLTSALAAGLSCASTTRKRAICVALSRCVLSAVFVPAPNGALEASLGGSWSGPRTKERLNKGIRYFPISAAIPLRIRTKNSTAPLTSNTNSLRKSGFINSSLRIVTTPSLLSGKMKCRTSIYSSYVLSEELRNTIRYCPQLVRGNTGEYKANMLESGCGRGPQARHWDHGCDPSRPASSVN